MKKSTSTKATAAILAIILSAAFSIGTVSDSEAGLKSWAKKKVTKVGKTVKNGGKYVKKKAFKGGKHIVKKAHKGGKYVGKKAFKGGKHIVKKAYKGGKWVRKNFGKGYIGDPVAGTVSDHRRGRILVDPPQVMILGRR